MAESRAELCTLCSAWDLGLHRGQGAFWRTLSRGPGNKMVPQLDRYLGVHWAVQEGRPMGAVGSVDLVESLPQWEPIVYVSRHPEFQLSCLPKVLPGLGSLRGDFSTGAEWCSPSRGGWKEEVPSPPHRSAFWREGIWPWSLESWVEGIVLRI